MYASMVRRGPMMQRVAMERRGRLALSWLLLFLFWLAWGTERPARSHPQFALSTVNRYGRLVLRGGEARLFYTLMIGDVPANALRQQADHNRDGSLDEAEQAALGAVLAGRVRSGVTLRGGAAIPLRWEPAVLKLDKPEVAPTAFAFELGASFPLDLHQPVELRYEDRVEQPPIGEVELRLEEAPGVRVEAAYEGQSPPAQGERRMLFQSYGPPRSSLSDRSVHVRVAGLQPPRPPDEDRRFGLATLGTFIAIGLAAVVLSLIGIALVVLRLRRRRRS
jgi:hypothetical protein